jgi:calmodulin
MAKRQKANEQEETLADAFKIFDLNGTNEITPEDIFGVLSRLGENVSLEEIREMYLEIDTQNAGKINYP